MKTKKRKKQTKPPDPDGFRCTTCGRQSHSAPGGPLPKGWTALTMATTAMLSGQRVQQAISCSWECLLISTHLMVDKTRAL